VKFDIIGEITGVVTIAAGKSLRDRRRLARRYGRGKWRKMKGQATVRLSDGTICEAEIHGMKLMVSERKNSNSKGRSASGKRIGSALSRAKRSSPAPSEDAAQGHFAICVRNDDYEASLELRKLYPVLEDDFGSQHGMIRVIDESGEDYLFPSEYFVRVSLPQAVEKKLRRIA
jgi:hypothetical protein